MKFQLIRTKLLQPSPTNPRKDFDGNRIDDMAESLKSVGMLEPILCVERKGYHEIVAGETRWRGAMRAELEEVPCVVREMSAKEIIHAQMAENISRASLNPMEEAEGLRQMAEIGEADEESISKTLGTSRKWVQDRLALNHLPDLAKDAVRVRAMSVGVAKEILGLEDGEREEAATMLLDFGEEITAAQARATLSERYRLPRERRLAWIERWNRELREEFAEIAVPLEDCEDWARYLRPYGEAYGHWVAGADCIGAAAARAPESGMTWAELGKALGVRGLLVPLHGEVYLLFDRAKIEAVEKAARESGRPHTLGPRKREDFQESGDGGQESDTTDDVGDGEADTDPDDDEDMEEYYIGRILEGLGERTYSEIEAAVEDQLREDAGEVLDLLTRLGLGGPVAALVTLRKEAE